MVRRRTVLARLATAVAATAMPALRARPADVPEFAYKYGTVLPDGHPMVVRSREAAERIKQESGGRLVITIYPNSTLGQDTAMMSEAMSGALQVYSLSLDILAQREPPAGIFGVGFAFDGSDEAFAAMDGALGDYVRGLAEKIGLFCIDKAFDHGFREITSRSKPIEKPEDLKGFHIRVPVAPQFVALFKHLGAAPSAINFGELYSALKTGLVDGQENPLILIDTAKLYEVQKYCSMTNHIWVGLHVAFNMAAWKRLPSELQEIAYRNFSQAALAERADWQSMNQTEMDGLREKGLVFNTPDIKPFRDALRDSGFYPDMKKQLGDQAWALLEKYVGSLA
ncbi:MAG TPA: TRAP transporter substrate-binding protein [Stellaceae bacterium]|nr:TRAP transporter substrate-binding protein [Stellaceae bacterium]